MEAVNFQVFVYQLHVHHGKINQWNLSHVLSYHSLIIPSYRQMQISVCFQTYLNQNFEPGI